MALFDTYQQNGTTMIGGPVLNSQVDAATETVEGRIGGLLATDSQGDYTNPVVKQTQQRQQQAFNARGLLNSSMAMQAGSEAAISKAADIAATDAGRYYDNRRNNLSTGNQLWSDQEQRSFQANQKLSDQGFTQRQDYQKGALSISQNFQRQLDTINSSSMSPEDKSVAIAQAQQQRDGELAYLNNLYAKMPQWQNDWAAAAVPTGGLELGNVTNQDTLANIVNDPAQPQAMRDAALRQLQALRSGAASGGGSMIGGGAATTQAAQQLQQTGGTGAPDASGLPTVIAGQAVNWDMANINTGGKTARQLYQEHRAGGGGLSPEQWWFYAFGNVYGQGDAGVDSASANAGVSAGGGFGSDANGIGNGGVVT